MPTQPLSIDQGVFTETTDRDGKGRWKDANRVRFHYDYPEKLGGWSALAESDVVPGACRETRQWLSLDDTIYIAYGTDTGLYIQKPNDADKSFHDITPADVRALTLGTLTDPFTTTSGSNVVTVTWVGHGLLVGGSAKFKGALECNGVPGSLLNQTHTILTVPDVNSFTLQVAVEASASGTGGGAVYPVYGLGYGTAAYNKGAWGRGINPSLTPRPVGAVPDNGGWSLAVWGENLIANTPGGKIYVWSPTTDGVGAPATQIPNSPEKVGFVVVSSEDEHLIALGCEPFGSTDHDPLLVRWADQGNYEDWQPTAVNTAGSIPLQEGNRIISGKVVGANVIIATDTHGYRMFPTGPPLTYGMTALGASEIASRNSLQDYRGVAYWMGLRNFYMYDGSLKVFDCAVWSRVFENLNYSMSHKIFSGVNRAFDEVWWFYPSANSSEVDRYVLFDAIKGTWSLGEMDRTAWDGEDTAFNRPYAVTKDGTVYIHELGNDAGGAPMGEFLESYDLDISTPGQDEVLRVNGVVPDFEKLEGSVRMTFSGKKRPHGGTTSKPPFTVTAKTQRYSTRLRARQISLRIEGLGSNGFWRMGPIQIDGHRDGRR